MLWSDRPTQAYVFRTCSEQGVTVALARLESVRAGRVRAPQIVRCPAREHDFHSASKLALDFLLRRATMTARQLPVPNFIQDGENPLGLGYTAAAREDGYDGRVQALAAAPT
jgi:hypothetical protein